MSNIADTLCDTIDMMVSHSINNAKFNRAIQAQIVNNDKGNEGIYRCKYQNALFDAVSLQNEGIFSVGSNVIILVINNDMEDIKIILCSLDKKQIANHDADIEEDSQGDFILKI